MRCFALCLAAWVQAKPRTPSLWAQRLSLANPIIRSVAKQSILPVPDIIRNHALIEVNALQKVRKLTNDQGHGSHQENFSRPLKQTCK
jgi:hypothetical protein